MSQLDPTSSARCLSPSPARAWAFAPGLRRAEPRSGSAAARFLVASSLAIVATACATPARVPPPRPTLPAVQFVPPCAPSATVGLTAQGVEELKRRDAAWRAHVQQLEAVIRGTPQ